ncbi:hypothetical protein DUI87_29732 [Hirundo rustica rustica]|uniref:Set2 Rpb1 interacting domain-containing protein n=1 Tax=Hirundo rustica rustica TaxID=333673 RepID=A0A3M0IYG1_HIRRU|nr:hypothetical protein DUI87_29732 [Hirundo rustica rustica]
MSQFIVQCLNPYRKPDCKVGRITTTEDFKHLARKLTHGVMNKELKYCKNPEDLECNENVKHKTKEYIKKYMQKIRDPLQAQRGHGAGITAGSPDSEPPTWAAHAMELGHTDTAWGHLGTPGDTWGQLGGHIRGMWPWGQPAPDT